MRTGRRRAMALPLALLLLAAGSALVATLATAATLEGRSARAVEAGEGARDRAEAGLEGALAAWRPDERAGDAIGAVVALGGGPAVRVRAIRLSPRAWWVVAEGEEGGARRRVGAVRVVAGDSAGVTGAVRAPRNRFDLW